MSTISAPSTVRQWRGCPALNSAHNDYLNDKSVRISLPCYVDLTTTQRKELLNAVRTIASGKTVSETSTISGLTVETATNQESDIESYLGMSLEVLRSVIFGRGGLEVSFLLRLQEATGLEYVSASDFTAAFKARQTQIKSYTKEYPFSN